jgi:hypothetical protein
MLETISVSFPGWGTNNYNVDTDVETVLTQYGIPFTVLKKYPTGIATSGSYYGEQGRYTIDSVVKSDNISGILYALGLPIPASQSSFTNNLNANTELYVAFGDANRLSISYAQLMQAEAAGLKPTLAEVQPNPPARPVFDTAALNNLIAAAPPVQQVQPETTNSQATDLANAAAVPGESFIQKHWLALLLIGVGVVGVGVAVAVARPHIKITQHIAAGAA